MLPTKEHYAALAADGAAFGLIREVTQRGVEPVKASMVKNNNTFDPEQSVLRALHLFVILSQACASRTYMRAGDCRALH